MTRRVLIVALLAACGGTPTALNITVEGDGGTSDASAAADDATSDGSTSDDDAQTDAGSDTGTTTVSVFGSSAFAPGSPGMNANAATGHVGQTPIEGKNCTQAGGCHSDLVRPLAISGTVYSTKAGTATVKGAEVRVVDMNGTTIGTTFSDDDGNFWIDGKLPVGNKYIGARTALLSMQQTLSLTAERISCNDSTCHGNATRIYVP